MKLTGLKLVCGFVLVLATGSGHAQVDSLFYNGEYVYVYPFEQEVEIHSQYWQLIDDKEFFADYNNYFNHFGGNFSFSRESFQKATTELRKQELQKELAKRWRNQLKGEGLGMSLTKLLRRQPADLLATEYSLNLDILPPFGNVPDGKYVQLFKEFCVVDEKGNCQPTQQRIAGIFEIRNNALDGKAVWLNFRGDTIKEGNYVNGLKEGEWLLKETEELSRNIYRWNRKYLKSQLRGTDVPDTLYVYRNYMNGVEHGPCRTIDKRDDTKDFGEYDRGVPSGEWTFYTGANLTERYRYANSTDTVISHKPILRGPFMQDSRTYYWRKKKDQLVMTPTIWPTFPKNFYSINFGKLRDERELEGESEQSFDLTNGQDILYLEPMDSGDENRNYYFPYFDVMERVPTANEEIARWKLIDDLGMRMTYDGVYEKFHPNGERFFRYEFVDGHLVSEDTLFWDNGVAHDIITFEPDSNVYYRDLYDRTGRQYDRMIYDSLGAFIRFQSDKIVIPDTLIIDGFPAEENDNNISYEDYVDSDYFFYWNHQAVKRDSMFEPVVIMRTWASRDTSLQLNREYDPISRTYKREYFNRFGEIIQSNVRTFTPNFSGWNGSESAQFERFTVKSTVSGILRDNLKVDSLGHRFVMNAIPYYNITTDHTLYAGEEPFSGALRFAYRPGMSKIKSSKKKANVLIQNSHFGSNKYYRKTKKESGNKEILRYAVNGVSRYAYSDRIRNEFSNLFNAMLYSSEKYSRFNSKGSYDGVKKVKGEILDGKPHGTWTAYSKGGKVISTLNFIHGEPEGELKIYGRQYPKPKKRRWGYYKYSYDHRNKWTYIDTSPPRKVDYLKYSIGFKNGMREGRSVEYDWLGRIKTDMNFENGLAEGEMIIRDETQFSEASFKFGMLDGYLRTYLTLPKMDTMLLYDINLQNDMLNGESRAYHTNGSLAKRGFFLDNEPIDDYEAYDTLGFKFHYIKFQYGQPVEEKIWEENALSIRYLFNWEDSILFNPDEITQSESFQSLLARNGYYQYPANEKYYGRPALIDKEGVECQMTKYYPNDTIARDGRLSDKRKTGLWKFYGYNGNFLYEANYFDSVIVINDSIQFKSKGILTDYDEKGNRLYSAYIIEKFEKYDCAHTDHYEIRQLLTIDEVNDSIGRMNGYVQNFYDNGTIQGEGNMKNGLPDGMWKFYDPFGKLNKMGNYVMGKRNGRWLEGDLAKKKYLGEICMNPNLENLEEMQKYQENLLDVTIINYLMGIVKNHQYFNVDMNRVMELEESREED